MSANGACRHSPHPQNPKLPKRRQVSALHFPKVSTKTPRLDALVAYAESAACATVYRCANRPVYFPKNPRLHDFSQDRCKPMRCKTLQRTTLAGNPAPSRREGATVPRRSRSPTSFPADQPAQRLILVLRAWGHRLAHRPRLRQYVRQPAAAYFGGQIGYRDRPSCACSASRSMPPAN